MGVGTLLLVLVAGSAAVKLGDDFVEPIAMIFGPIAYGIFANLAYTGGAVLDIGFFRGRPRKKLFKFGYVFSLVLTGLPGIWAVMAWLITIVTGEKL